MIGHGALVPGSSMELKEGKGLAGLDIPQSADSVKVQIKDGGGSVVRTMLLGAQKSGVVPLSWDGLNDAGEKAPEGAYKISAEYVAGGETSAAKTLSFGEVSGMVPGSGGAKLNINGLGVFNLADVKQIV
jgi:flagellar basal-body rod modification protein FlgD